MSARNEPRAWREVAACYDAPGVASVTLGDAIEWFPGSISIRFAMHHRFNAHEQLRTLPLDNDARCLACLWMALEAEGAT